MTVAVRGRVPREGEGVYDARVATHIRERLQALERAVAGGGSPFTSPTYPLFGAGNATVASGGGTVIPPTTTTTTIIQQRALLSDQFLLMGC